MTTHVLNKDQLRQGDVLCDRIESVPPSMRPMKPDADGSATLAHGEVTGHRHRFRASADGASDSMLYSHTAAVSQPARMTVSAPSRLVHEEHSALSFLPGDYRISFPFEYLGTELRQVAD